MWTARTAVDSTCGEPLEGFGWPVPTAVGDEKWRLRRLSNAADVEAYEENSQSETRARACVCARSRTRARRVFPRGAKQKHVAARAFRRHDPNDSPCRTRLITGRLNAVPLIRIARLPAADGGGTACSTLSAAQVQETGGVREPSRPDYAPCGSRRLERSGEREPDDCTHGAEPAVGRFEASVHCWMLTNACATSRSDAALKLW